MFSVFFLYHHNIISTALSFSLSLTHLLKTDIKEASEIKVNHHCFPK